MPCGTEWSFEKTTNAFAYILVPSSLVNLQLKTHSYPLKHQINGYRLLIVTVVNQPVTFRQAALSNTFKTKLPADKILADANQIQTMNQPVHLLQPEKINIIF